MFIDGQSETCTANNFLALSHVSLHTVLLVCHSKQLHDTVTISSLTQSV